MSGCVRGRNKEVDAAFNKAFVIVAELGARHFLQAIGKAPAFELVLKYPIAFVVKHAWHGEPPWPGPKAAGSKSLLRILWNGRAKSSRRPGRILLTAWTVADDRGARETRVPLVYSETTEHCCAPA